MDHKNGGQNTTEETYNTVKTQRCSHKNSKITKINIYDAPEEQFSIQMIKS